MRNSNTWITTQKKLKSSDKIANKRDKLERTLSDTIFY